MIVREDVGETVRHSSLLRRRSVCLCGDHEASKKRVYYYIPLVAPLGLGNLNFMWSFEPTLFDTPSIAQYGSILSDYICNMNYFAGKKNEYKNIKETTLLQTT